MKSRSMTGVLTVAALQQELCRDRPSQTPWLHGKSANGIYQGDLGQLLASPFDYHRLSYRSICLAAVDIVSSGPYVVAAVGAVTHCMATKSNSTRSILSNSTLFHFDNVALCHFCHSVVAVGLSSYYDIALNSTRLLSKVDYSNDNL